MKDFSARVLPSPTRHTTRLNRAQRTGEINVNAGSGRETGARMRQNAPAAPASAGGFKLKRA
jgi:hypothetical protein